MSLALKERSYPHIDCDPEIAGGAPIIAGTRITVRCVAGYYQMGMTVDEILNTLSHLAPSEVHSALAYYFDHQEEIERALIESSDIDFWRSQVLSSHVQDAEKNEGQAFVG
jgi:uncharacterized protein (DUF433 family)